MALGRSDTKLNMVLGRFLKIWSRDGFLLYGPSTNYRLWPYSLQPFWQITLIWKTHFFSSQSWQKPISWSVKAEANKGREWTTRTIRQSAKEENWFIYTIVILHVQCVSLDSPSFLLFTYTLKYKSRRGKVSAWKGCLWSSILFQDMYT